VDDDAGVDNAHAPADAHVLQVVDTRQGQALEEHALPVVVQVAP